MNVLLDECLPRRLTRELEDLVISTVRDQGWSGKKNGELLSLAEKEFDVFVTIDKNLPHQQSLPNYDLAILLIETPDNTLRTLRRAIPQVREALMMIRPRSIVRITVQPVNR